MRFYAPTFFSSTSLTSLRFILLSCHFLATFLQLTANRYFFVLQNRLGVPLSFLDCCRPLSLLLNAHKSILLFASIHYLVHSPLVISDALLEEFTHQRITVCYFFHNPGHDAAGCIKSFALVTHAAILFLNDLYARLAQLHLKPLWDVPNEVSENHQKRGVKGSISSEMCVALFHALQQTQL